MGKGVKKAECIAPRWHNGKITEIGLATGKVIVQVDHEGELAPLVSAFFK